MTKKELVKKISEDILNNTEVKLSNEKVGLVLDSLGRVVPTELASDREGKIALPGLGKFSVKHVESRSGVAMGKSWTKAAHDEITFKISKMIKELD